ncbi:MAG: CvpA family protein [Bacilli bacterium]|nr:CvpA family protein [Bacilli bacterium]
MDNLLTFAFDISTFDWISIAFWVIIALRVIMGFVNGGFKTLMKIIVLAAAIGLAFALCKIVGTWIGNMGLHATIENALFSSLSKSNETLGKTMTQADLDALYLYWRAAGNLGTKQDMIVELLHQGYGTMYIPSGIYGTLDNMILGALPAETDLTTTFSFAGIISKIVADAALVGIGFLAVFLVILIVGLIIVALVFRGRKLAGKKPGFLNRLLGVAIGAGYGFFICWTASIGIKSLMTAFPPFNDWINTSMQLANNGYWNIGKFFMNINFGYSDLLNWFLSLVNTITGNGAATSSSLSSVTSV